MTMSDKGIPLNETTHHLRLVKISRGDDMQCGVGGVTFLVNKLGEETLPLQHIRELTQNSIDAILRTKRENGRIEWSYDEAYYAENKTYKLRISDNGNGMNSAELSKYMNRLASSCSEQSSHGNYGVGAKIAALYRNPYGVVIKSFKEGKGSQIRLWKDPESGLYGLARFEAEDENCGDTVMEIDESSNEKFSKIYGEVSTTVTLLGYNREDNTCLPPEDAVDQTFEWLAYYLNTRYFEFPDNIDIAVRNGWNRSKGLNKKSQMVSIHGAKEHLEKHSENKGSIQLKDCTIHWWILKEEYPNASGRHKDSGYICALYNKELYHMPHSGHESKSRFQKFGIWCGYNRVYIVIEPKLDHILSGLSRTSLSQDGKDLPWDTWGSLFRAKMPEEIVKYLDKNAPTRDESHINKIRDNLKPFMEMFSSKRYTPSKDGGLNVDPGASINGGKPAVSCGKDFKKKADSRSSKSTKGGGLGEKPRFTKSGEGAKARETTSSAFPETFWVHDNLPEELEGRAAMYDFVNHKLTINGSFKSLVDCKKFIESQPEFYGIVGIRDIIDEQTHLWFESCLIETVLSAKGMQGMPRWTREKVEQILSPDSLTAAVLPRAALMQVLKRNIGRLAHGRLVQTDTAT